MLGLDEGRRGSFREEDSDRGPERKKIDAEVEASWRKEKGGRVEGCSGWEGRREGKGEWERRWSARISPLRGIFFEKELGNSQKDIFDYEGV